ncbi:MAG: Smr/MutS family protein, partial [Clostridia bacterium]|nr:Smr/MutS family protein [Clostridia bacterium]
ALAPELNDAGVVRIVRGRHPLLPKGEAVPVDIWLGDDFRTLIITGPNTGGKTVTLKTVGLFTLMAQSGLFIPASAGTRISVFEQVYADIGDEQSIEQSLSTFSSHMTRIVAILNGAGEKSLVLLDELGAGTDPVEGAALAMSILEALHARSAVTLATTHYSEIKAFALSREGMENASMEFDIEKLEPTFRLFVGIPGKSNAFEISRRLGLDGAVIERARTFLKQEDIRFEDIISSAESQRRIAERERELARQARDELEKLRAQAEEERRKLADSRRTYQQRARDEMKRSVEEARRELERQIARVRSMTDVDRSDADRVIQSARDEVRRIERSIPEVEEPAPVSAGDAPKSVKLGDEVRVLSIDKHGTVLYYDGKGEALVQVGIMRITARLDDLRLEGGQDAGRDGGKIDVNREPVGLSLDIRGKTVDEAEVEIERYLEAATMHRLQEVVIIHGKGTGALRAGVHAYLKGHRLVKSYRMGAYGEGDAGVTSVTLREFGK